MQYLYYSTVVQKTGSSPYLVSFQVQMHVLRSIPVNIFVSTMGTPTSASVILDMC